MAEMVKPLEDCASVEGVRRGIDALNLEITDLIGTSSR